MKITNALGFLMGMLFSLTSMALSPLPAEAIFHLSAKPIDPNTLALTWNINPGYFLYQERIHLSPTDTDAFQLGETRFPKAHKKIDKLGETLSIYRERLVLPITVLGDAPGEHLIKLSYQGCADDGFCYPPETRLIKLAFNSTNALENVSIEPVETNVITPPQNETTQNKINHLFSQGHWIIMLLTFLGFGLLLSFTPCVLPMIPVLSSIIMGQNVLSTKKAFRLSLCYVLSMATTYAIFGALVASAGSNLQMMMQAPIVIVLFSVLFIALALSMFGLYDLKMPQTLHTKLSALSTRQTRGQYLGVATMGCLATLILSPCVTAPLIGILGYIASTGDLIKGALALFFLGLGMGLPLLVIGTSAGHWLPKAGHWMNIIKAFFGILLIGVALLLLARLLPGSHTDSLKVTTLSAIQNQLNEAKTQKKLAILDFYANWCTSCKLMEKTTLRDPAVISAMHDIKWITVDITKNDADSKAILQYFHVIAPPTLLFYSHEGNALTSLQMVGEINASALLQQIKEADKKD